MESCNSVINKINEIKQKFDNNSYKSGDELEKAIDKFNEELWCDIDEIEISDLKDICNLHEFLIQQVCTIHNDEESEINNNIIKKNIDLKKIHSDTEDGKMASKIYLFNDYKHEYFFVGDIHSDDFIINRILNSSNFFESMVSKKAVRLIFLGDYVDRGKSHLKLMEKILVLKYIFPGNIFLMRGNHDGGNVEYNVVKLCVGKPIEDKDEDYFLLYLDNLSKLNGSFSGELISSYLKLFYSMAIISIVNVKDKTILAVHGGLPRPKRNKEKIFGYISSISDLTNEDIVDVIDRNIIDNMIWSDPLRDDLSLREESGRFRFTEDEFYNFCDYLKIDILIRGHEAHEQGYEKYYNDRLYSIFSSGAIIYEDKNINLSTAYTDVTPHIIKINTKQQISLIRVR